MIIYKLENLKNGKVIIGLTTQTLQRRWVQHRSVLRLGRHTNAHLQAAWSADGEASFELSVLETLCGKTKIELQAAEIRWIAHFRSNHRDFGYNLTSGGEGVRDWCPSKEWRMKKSLKMTGKKLPPFTSEHRENLAAARRGTKMHPNSVRALAKYQRENFEAVVKNLDRARAKACPKKRMEALLLARAKFAKLNADPAWRERRKRKVQKSCAIKVIDQYGTVYSSLSDAARAIGSSAINIRQQLRGRYKHNHGYVFRECGLENKLATKTNT